MFDLDHPFFRPLWIRLAVVGVSLGWAGVELARGAPFWAALFGAAGLFAAYQFFVRGVPKDDDQPGD